MNRRTLLCGLTLGALSTRLVTEAQQSRKIYRVGRLSVSVLDSPSIEAFRRGLRELGWAVDQDLLVEIRTADGDAKRLSAMAAELVRMDVDVIVAAGSDAVEAAFRATKSIPIVMAVGTDPERRGWIKSLARPGGNVTGLIAFLPEMGSKRIELVKDLLPRARRVGVMTDSVQPSSRVLDLLRSRIAAFGISARLPVIGAIPFHAESGFLLSYGASSVGWAHRSAYFVDKILKGAKPADLPVEQPTKFELVINLKTAKALGLTIPKTLLLRADQVIEQ